MHRSVRFSVLFILIAISPCLRAWEQSDAAFAAALRDTSTSPRYVRITVINALTNEAQTYCTTANLLRGAIAKENQLNGRSVTFEDQREAAMVAPGHLFRFKQQTAMDNMPRTYSEEDLVRVRNVLSPLSTDALPRVPPNNLNTMIPGSRHTVDGALACVLMERGFTPYQADTTGQVRFIEQR